MAKDPAFLFYPNDYLGGTMGMTFEEKGAYVELLMVQFNRGHMTSHMIAHTVGQLWDNIKGKFIQDAEGLWFNERLDSEKDKRANFTKSRRNNIKGVNQYNKKEEKKEPHMNGHMTSHMENENRNVNEIELIRCIEISLKDERWIRLNKTNVTELQIFKTKLETEGINYKTPIDFKTHFARWKKKQPDDLKAVQTTRISI